MQDIIPIACRASMHSQSHVKLVRVIFELSSFFKGLCGKVLDPHELDELEHKAAKTLCDMETIFPPSFFTIMVHLIIHLVSEVKLGGPVMYRWMYPIERYLVRLKSYVRNRAQPEGSRALKEVEIIDVNGNKRKKKYIRSKELLKMADVERVIVEVNECGQPIGDARGILTRWMSTLIKQPNLCPPDATDFKEVKDHYGVELLRNIRLKFMFPNHDKVDKVLIALLGVKFRITRKKLIDKLHGEARSRLRSKVKERLEASGVCGEELETLLREHQYEVSDVDQELDNLPVPVGFTPPQWLKLKNYIKSDKYKELSRKGKAARASKSHNHVTGTTSFAQVHNDFERRKKRKAGHLEFFDLTYMKEDGGYTQKDSENFMNAAKEMMEQLKSSGSYSSQHELESVVWERLMGSEKPGRARGHGTGVTKSQLSGFGADLMRMRNETARHDDSTSRIKHLENMVLQQQQIITQFMSATTQTMSSMDSEIRLCRTACGIFGGNPIQAPHGEAELQANVISNTQVPNQPSNNNANESTRRRSFP